MDPRPGAFPQAGQGVNEPRAFLRSLFDAAVDAHWPAEAPLSGLVVTRYGHVPPAYAARPGRIEVVEAAHP
ncbi:MAG: hypothetical protein ACM3II_15365, partial [Rhodospirillaceae bacterium]